MTTTASEPPPPGWWHRAADRLATTRISHLSLRTRVLLMFSTGALVLGAFLALAGYSFTRSSLVTQRERTAVNESTLHASIVEAELRSAPATAAAALDRLAVLGVEHPVVAYRDEWTAGSALGAEQLPSTLVERVTTDGQAARMVQEIDGEFFVIVGLPLIATGGAYFEYVSLDQVSDTLSSVALSLLFAALITTMFGLLLGWIVAARAVRPLGEAAQAARLIAGGRLDTRLDITDDPDLRLLATSFNEMAAALQARVEKDARFASDVSHELRSPLMTLAASAEVLQSRRDDLPERAQQALDLLVSDVTRFQGLVEDLLEISRYDAGAVRLHREELLVAEFVRQAVAVSSMPSTPITVSERGASMIIEGDRRRLARVIANLIDNARVHGGGDATVEVHEVDDATVVDPALREPATLVRIAVEDHGAGVPFDERDLVFERFARGAVAGRRSSSDGAGLGLALVDEHVRLHGGRVWVEDRLDGEPGARFVIELPAEELR